VPRGKRNQKWQAGDNFAVPLADGTYGQGQVLSYEAQAMNSAICAFSSARYANIPVDLDFVYDQNLIAVLFVTRDLLDSGRWQVVNSRPMILLEKYIDIRSLRKKGFVGATIHGSHIAETFLNAYHKLSPWNQYLDPEYFDKLLVAPNRKPRGVLLK
jgi:hypothetical protein